MKAGESTPITARFNPADFQPDNPQWLVIAPPGNYIYGQFTVSAVQQEGDRWTGTVTAGERLGVAQITLKANNVSQALSREAAQLIGSVTDETQAGVSTLTVNPAEVTANNWQAAAFEIIGSPKNSTDSLTGTLDVSVDNPQAAQLLGIDYEDDQHARIYFQVFNATSDPITVTGQVAALNYQSAQFKIIIRPSPIPPIVPLTGDNGFTEPPVFLPPQTFNDPSTNPVARPLFAQQVLSWLTPTQTHAQTTAYGCVTLIIHVQDQDTQAPIQNAQVKLWSWGGPSYPITATDSSGQAAINDVIILVYRNTTTPAPYYLNVTYYHPQSRNEYTTAKTITIPPDQAGKVYKETVGLKIEEADRPCDEDASVTVSGTITDKDGNPLKEAMVVWDNWQNLAFTNNLGQYTVEDLPPGTVYGLLVFRSDATEATPDPDLVYLPCGKKTAQVDIKTQ